jgi:heme oxygenase
MPATPTRSFSEVLREGTAVEHERAENSPFVVALVEGRLPLADYTRMIRQLHVVYSSLEAVVSEFKEPDLAPLLAPELARATALADDLDYLAGPGWSTTLPVLAETTAYADRIHEAGTASRGGLLAHHYVRYLGDLSGGQVLRRIVTRIYELSDGLGTSAYHFAEIESPKRFKDEYRARIDALPWPAAERARVVDEAIVAFQCNRAIFDALEALRWSRRLPNPPKPRDSGHPGAVTRR